MAVVQNGSKVKNSKERSRQISSLTPPIGGPSVNLGEGPSLTPTEVGGWGVVRGFRFGLAGWVYLGIDLVRPALFGGSPCVESGFASLICGCSATLVTSTRGSLPDPQGHKGRTEEAPLTAAAVPHARGGQETQLQLSHWRTASPRIYIYIYTYRPRREAKTKKRTLVGVRRLNSNCPTGVRLLYIYPPHHQTVKKTVVRLHDHSCMGRSF